MELQLGWNWLHAQRCLTILLAERVSCVTKQKDGVSGEEETIHLTTLTFLIAS